MEPIPAKPVFAETSPYWQAARQVYITMRQLGAKNPLAIAAVANADLESAFHTDILGDHLSAFNLFQWHSDRANRIAENTGIDVKSERSIPRVIAGLWWEITHLKPFAKAFSDMEMAQTAEEAAGTFCVSIEGAGALDAKQRRMADAAWWTKAIADHTEFFRLPLDP